MSTRIERTPDLGGDAGSLAGSPGGARESALWIARELHDGPVQALTAVVFDLEAVQQHVSAPHALEAIREASIGARGVLASLRSLIGGIRDTPLGEGDFVEAVSRHARRLERRTGMSVQLTIDPAWPTALDTMTAFHLRRIIEEALANASQHSGAKRVEIDLVSERRSASRSALSVSVRDDGCWKTAEGYEGGGRGYGLQGMEERASAVGGTLTVETDAGRGTEVTVVLPLPVALVPDEKRFGRERP